MRLEIVVPETAPERIRQRLADLVRCLNKTPDMVEDLMQQVEDIRAGNALSVDEV